MSRNLALRIGVAVLAIPAILWLAYEGGLWWLGFVLLLALVGTLEFLSAEKTRLVSLFGGAALATVILSLLLSARQVFLGSPLGDWLQTASFGLYWFSPLVLFFVITALASGLSRVGNADMVFTRLTRLTWGVAYLSLLYPFVWLISDFPTRFPGQDIAGGDLLLWLLATLWITDTTAMGIGAWLGKRPLAPVVSPRKTLVGFIGGLIGGLAAGVAITAWRLPGLELTGVIFATLAISLVGQLGDLVESLWKRSAGIKDSSVLIPAHGGVLDRFDSLLFAAPVMYAYLLLTAR